jgi:hypothetical protein
VNNGIIPGKIGKPEKAEDEDGGENKDAINQLLLR